MAKLIGIITATVEELEAVSKNMIIESEQELASLKYFKGKLAGVDCVVTKCGAGKVNAAVSAQVLTDKFSPDIIINTGAAGGIGKNIRIGDIVLASACVQHDMDTTAFGDEPGFIWGIEIKEIPCDKEIISILKQKAEKLYGHVHTGIIATGDTFIADKDKSRWLSETFNAVACEMEGASIAHVCYMNKVPVAVIRAISDNADDDGKVSYESFARHAAENCVKLLSESLLEL